MESYGTTAPDPSKALSPQMLISSDGDTCNIQKKDTAMGKVKMFFTRNGRFPNSIFFIIGNEFCERFSYYGMKTILVIYLTQSLGFHADPATALYHGFSMLCYFTPLVGAILADGYLGKFRTILYISIVYALGNIVMALTAIPPPQWIGMLVGLLLIGVGTGGIKPCVAAFGGDQFSPDQEKAVQSFFSVFYFTINAGSLLSTFLTPILRADVQCFGHDCYPLAFGVPACLMILSLVIFVCGRKLYKNYPPTGSLIGRVLRCIWRGIRKKLSSAEKADHWLDRTTDTFELDFVDDVKRLLKVLLIFLPLPVFWALFDQQGSRWTLQAEQMDGEVVGGWRLKPDQMQAVNPILILLFIPVFEKFIYPLLDKCKVPNRPLQRMVAGMVLAAVAFVTAGFLQIRIDSSVEQPLGRNESGFTVINVLPCPVSVKSADLLYGDNLPRFTASEFQRYESGNYSVVMETDGSCPISSSMTANVELKPESAFRFVVYQMGGIIKMQQLLDLREKPKKGNASVSVISLVEGASSPRRVVLMNDDGELRVDLTADSPAQFHHLSAGSYGVYLQQDNETMKYTTQEVTLDNGAVYTVILIGAMDDQGQLRVHRFVGLLPNVVSMGYQVPQYIVLTMAEVMFSITGLSFAYSQAPTSMKSVLQAAWLLTIAVGNLIVLIVAEVKAIPSQAVEFFLFAVLMTVDIVVFAVMAWFYKYTTPTYHDQLEFADTTGLVTSSEPEDHSQRVKQQ